ncbi:alpha/beta fold hydrolase [Streptomyces sp. NPDC001812]|uniref:Alpha/beta hydrolase n=1 Tax=Streptomyces cathayae TaxID=3031124 RepID=A0ABY8JWR7_9ACTN|nr:alpha/beta hydrolase [Streptomyces sp. HUAS 5]WGD39659.1 alpha/beta hydrolase [Streptomyces sp. HUAS 5]
MTSTDTLTEQSTSRTLRTPSWRLHYNEAGKGHPVVLLHGSGPGATGWSNFAPNIPALAEHFRVIALDAPGWGASDPGLPATYDHPNAVLELLDALGIERAALVGNSMGGSTAVTFAARYPERVSHLATMGVVALTEFPTVYGASDGPSEGLKLLFETYRRPTLENMRRLVDVMTYGQVEDAEQLAQERLDNALAHPKHLANFVEGLATGGPVQTRAALKDVTAISAPALLIHGRDDRVVSHEHSLRLLPVLQDARLVLLNKCGHWAQLEHADRFNRLLVDFITRD